MTAALERNMERAEEESGKRRGRLLLVDDNAGYRATIRAEVERLGFEVDTARNGREALDALGSGAYDLILMDCEMPEMDGYETTAEIRRCEESVICSGPAPHLPIIAVTANVAACDRERCLEAGMDDYVPKPVRSEELRAAILACLDASPRTERRGSRTDGAGGGVVFDHRDLLDRLCDDGELVADLAAVFVADIPAQIEALAAAIEHGNAEAVTLRSHSIKGAAANVAAERMREAALSIETASKEGDLERAASEMSRLRIEFEDLRAAFRESGLGPRQS